MKIALYHNLPSGGARRAMVELAKGLVALGYNMDEICPSTADRSFLPLDGYVRRRMVIPFAPRGVASHRIPLLTPYLNAARLAGDLHALSAAGRRAAQMIDDQTYDLVFSHDCRWVLFPDLLRFLRSTPAVHYLHSGASSNRQAAPESQSEAGRSSLLAWAKGAYYAFPNHLYPWLRKRRSAQNIRYADQILTNSAYARAQVLETYGVSAQVCYLGVDVALFRPLGLDREAYVLSVGALHYFKGYRFLVAALGRLPADRRPPLVIAANSVEPQEQQVVEGLAHALGVRLSIECVRDDRRLVELYNRAAALVYTPIMEPFGLVVLEAMACGAPVVAVGEGGVRESVVHGETGFLVPRDEDLFAASLARVLADRSLAKRLGEAGAQLARARWTWQQAAERVDVILRQVARRDG